jgi:hypothetical protein
MRRERRESRAGARRRSERRRSSSASDDDGGGFQCAMREQRSTDAPAVLGYHEVADANNCRECQPEKWELWASSAG